MICSFLHATDYTPRVSHVTKLTVILCWTNRAVWVVLQLAFIVHIYVVYLLNQI